MTLLRLVRRVFTGLKKKEAGDVLRSTWFCSIDLVLVLLDLHLLDLQQVEQNQVAVHGSMVTDR